MPKLLVFSPPQSLTRSHFSPRSNFSYPFQNSKKEEKFQFFQFKDLIKKTHLEIDRNSIRMEIECVNCDCCGLKEECTQDYITSVKLEFQGKWLCGLCSESVRDEVAEKEKCNNNRSKKTMEEAVRSHMSFCGGFRSNPAVQVADGMRQMLLRRRSGDFSTPSSSSSSRKNLSFADRKLY